MPFQLVTTDRNASESVSIILPSKPEIAGGIEGISEYLDVPLEFQFPPRVTADSKNSNWREREVITYEPIAIFMGSGPRNINIEFEYVVTGEQWSGEKITRIAQAVKSYFYRSVQNTVRFSGDEEGAIGPAITIRKLYGAVYGGASTVNSTWRLLQVDVSYSDTLVFEAQSYWPLKTKISMSCASYTQIGGFNEDPKMGAASNLEEFPRPSWY